MKLTKLNSEQHSDLCVTSENKFALIATQHIIRIQATEIGKAISDFPIFFNRHPTTGTLGISAITSLETGKNLFVIDNEWRATYQPTIVQTHPLHLMASESDDKGYTIGIDEDAANSDTSGGERLFEEDGKPSMYQRQIVSQLENDLQDEMRTRSFAAMLEERELLRPINILVHYEDDSIQTITGLIVLDEDKLQALSGAALEDLNKNGYLVAMHATLVSLFQLNALIRRHNAAGLRPVRNIKLEVVRNVGSE